MNDCLWIHVEHFEQAHDGGLLDIGFIIHEQFPDNGEDVVDIVCRFERAKVPESEPSNFG